MSYYIYNVYQSKSWAASGSLLYFIPDPSLKRRHHRDPEGRGQNHQR